ncbi:DODA-type extradiol aromatic ring-opening family dioxygenase [Streptomyces aculeolatus]
MAEIVAAAAAVHAPQLLSRPPYEEIDKLDTSTDALHAFGKVVEDARPDAVVVIGIDHLETFWLEAVPAFTLVISEECDASYTKWRRRKKIHTSLAKDLLKGVIAQDFDLTYSQDAELGHAFLTPFEHILGDSEVPVIPLLVNTYLPPIPSPRRCYALGRAIARALADRPERIAVIASGGMSHFPGTARYTAPNYAFDRWLIQETAAGRYDDLLGLTPVNLDEVGESELVTWCVLLGMTGGELPGSLLSYQELSHHGHGVIQFVPGLPPAAEKPAEERLPRYGGHSFTQDDYVYYRFPEPSSLPLNRFLRQIITQDDARTAFAHDRDAAIAASGLGAEERAALAAEGFDQLVELGAHPLLALSAWQVVKNELAAAG